MTTGTRGRVAVTGGSGKLGSATIELLAAAGWTVHNFDVAPPRSTSPASFTRIDLTEFGQVVEAFGGIDELHDGVDAVVHLAAIPGATHAANTATFTNNISATYNVFTAARLAGVKRIVWASSETLLGYPFVDTVPPYVPMDEEYPVQGNVAYSLAKVLEEELARQFVRRYPDLTMVGLRFSNVISPDGYGDFPFDADPASRKWNLWGYIDARDAARAVQLALDAPLTGFEAVNIAAADTVLTAPTREALQRYFPDVEVRGEIAGTSGLTSIEKAERLLGWQPAHRWQDGRA